MESRRQDQTRLIHATMWLCINTSLDATSQANDLHRGQQCSVYCLNEVINKLNVGDLTQAKHKSAAFVVIVLFSLDLMVTGQCLHMFKEQCPLTLLSP